MRSPYNKERTDGHLDLPPLRHRTDHGGRLLLSPVQALPRQRGRRGLPPGGPGDVSSRPASGGSPSGSSGAPGGPRRRALPRLAVRRGLPIGRPDAGDGHVHPHLLPGHHALHRAPHRDEEARMARPGPPRRPVQGEADGRGRKAPRHERHHRRPHRRPLRHRVRRGNARRPAVRPQGAPGRGRLARRPEAAAGPARPRRPRPSPEVLPW